MADRSEYWKKRWAKQKEEGTTDRQSIGKRDGRRRNLNPAPMSNPNQKGGRSPKKIDTVKDITTITTRHILKDSNVVTPKDTSTEMSQKDTKRNYLTILMDV